MVVVAPGFSIIIPTYNRAALLGTALASVQALRLPEGWPSHEALFQMLLYQQRQKKYSSGWARTLFNKRAGCWPPAHWSDLAAIPPNKRVRNWLIHRSIAYAAVQRKLKAQGYG